MLIGFRPWKSAFKLSASVASSFYKGYSKSVLGVGLIENKIPPKAEQYSKKRHMMSVPNVLQQPQMAKTIRFRCNGPNRRLLGAQASLPARLAKKTLRKKPRVS